MKRSALPFLLCASSASLAADLDFHRDIYPFLKSNCIPCHNKTTAKAGLNMETPERMIEGGDAGPALVPGSSARSLILAASLHEQNLEMPPANNKSGAEKLTPAEIALLRQWIDQGAKASAREERAIVLKSIPASVEPIYCAAVTQDGRFAACGRSNQIFIYDLAARRLVARLSDPGEPGGAAHRAMVQALAFSPDGNRLASGSFREVKIWQMTTAQPAKNKARTAAAAPPASPDWIKKISAAEKVAVLSSAMSADGGQVVTGCADGSVRLWDNAGAKQLMELRGTVGAARKTAELEWTIAAQTLEISFQKSQITRIEAQEKALDVLLGKAREAIVAMNKVLPEKQKAVPPASGAAAAARKTVDELAAKLAAAPDAALEKELQSAQDKLITAAMAETAALAAVSAAESNIQDAEADAQRITESKAANEKAVAEANAAIKSAQAAQDKAAADLAALKKTLAEMTAKPVAVSFSDDSQRVAALFDDGVLRVWAAASGTPLEETGDQAAVAATITTAPDGSFAAVQTRALIAGGSPRWTLERVINEPGLFADRVHALRFSPDGKTLATGGGELSRSGDVILLDPATGKAARTWRELHDDTVLCLDFSPDGQHLATGAADKIARVIEVASGKPAHTFEGHTHHVTGVAFRSDGRVLATSGAEGSVVTWDLIAGERKKKIEGWSKEVTSLQFIGATNQIVTSAGDQRVRIVTDEGAEVRSMANLPDYMQVAVSARDGGAILAGGEDSLLRVWDSAGTEIAAFGAKESPDREKAPPLNP